jgi:DNA-binding transcriptional MerR regulator
VADNVVDIPERELFKAAEVCEIAAVQPYVLRSWESEFPSLGFVKTPGAARQYRRGDVERVLRIKQLVYVEGLTLAGARRRLDDDAPTVDDGVLAGAPPETRRKLEGIKGELRSLLEVLGGPPVRAMKSRRTSGDGQPTLLDLSAEAGSEAVAVDGESGGAAKKKARAPRRKAAIQSE